MTHLLRRILGVPSQRGRVSDAAILPVRLFLGGACIGAGLRTLADPRFVSPTAPGFIRCPVSDVVHTGSPLSPRRMSRAVHPHAATTGAARAEHARKGQRTPAPRPLGPDPLAWSAFVCGLGAVAASVVSGGHAGGLVMLRAEPGRHRHSDGPGVQPHRRECTAGVTGTPIGVVVVPMTPAGTTFLGNVKGLSITSAGQYTDSVSGNLAVAVRTRARAHES